MPELLLLEGEDLPELMARVREELGPRATIVRAERVRHGGVAGFFSRERYELTVEVPDRPRRPSSPSSPAVPAGPDSLEALLDAADRAEAGVVVTPSAPQVSTAGARFAAVLDGVRALAGDEVPRPDDWPEPPAADPAPAGPAPITATRVVAALPVPGGVSWGRSVVALVAAGVPSELLEGADGVSEVLRRIPEPPPAPRGPGQVLVVVGPSEATAAVAALLRLRWDLPDEAVVATGTEGLTSTAGVVRWRVRTVQAQHPWVLLVGVADDDTGRRQAAGLVAAAQADGVWAVVDARTKAADTARWLEEVGTARRPDALAVTGLLETSDPGTVLGLGVPVAWADGIPASRALWASVLGQSVDAALTDRR